jgi:16S rRNA (cytosine967-C5)-methyltransferase
VSGKEPRSADGRPENVRAVAAEILQRVEQGGFSNLLVRGAGDRFSRQSDRALLRELVGGALRWRGRLDFLLNRYSRRALTSLQPELLQHLRLGLYQLVFLDRLPDWAVVNETVEAAGRSCGRQAVSYANGVLRAAARERGQYPDPRRNPSKPWRFISHRFSLPFWLARRWVERFGAAEAEQLAVASAARPPVVFRMPRIAGRPWAGEDQVLQQLSRDGVESVPHALFPGAWQVAAGMLPGTQAFQEGRVLVQDPASQVIPLLTGLQPGQWALDGCAAPGAKTIRLAELAGPGGRVVAADLQINRLALVGENASRMGCSWVLPLVCDLSAPPVRGRRFHTVLVDAPCSGTGTLRRHPEIRWRLDPGALAKLARAQLGILRGSAGLVAEGGTLVYSVCSLEAEEGPGVVEQFLAGGGFQLDDTAPWLPPGLGGLSLPDGALRSLPHRDGCDGFYAARMVRRG